MGERGSELVASREVLVRTDAIVGEAESFLASSAPSTSLHSAPPDQRRPTACWPESGSAES